MKVTKKKATFFKLLRMKKMLYAGYAVRLSSTCAEIIAAVGDYWALGCVAAICFYCGFFGRFSGNN